jgi:hypothetical protein
MESRSYESCRALEEHLGLMLRHDQQVIRALTNNMTDNNEFMSAPKLVSDLLFVSDLLKPMEKELRNDALVNFITEINRNLPCEVYIPIVPLDFQYTDTKLKKKKRVKKVETCLVKPHKILSISTDHAFCLHSKERTPFHIFIEVAFVDS